MSYFWFPANPLSGVPRLRGGADAIKSHILVSYANTQHNRPCGNYS